MNDTLATVVIVLLVVNLIGLFAVGLIVNGQSRENKELENRLTMVEARVSTLPTHADLLALRTDLSNVVRTCAEIDGRTAAIVQTLRTIQDHLLESGR